MHLLAMSCMILSVFVVVENVKDTNAKLTFTMVATALLFDAFLTLFSICLLVEVRFIKKSKLHCCGIELRVLSVCVKISEDGLVPK